MGVCFGRPFSAAASFPAASTAAGAAGSIALNVYGVSPPEAMDCWGGGSGLCHLSNVGIGDGESIRKPSISGGTTGIKLVYHCLPDGRMIAKGEPETPPARLSSAACREDACGDPSLDAMNLGTSFNNLSYDGSKDLCSSNTSGGTSFDHTGVQESDGRILTKNT